MNRGGYGRSGWGGRARKGIRAGDGQVIQVVPGGLFYPERKRIPFGWMLLWQAICALVAAAVWLGRQARRHPLVAVVVVLVTVVWARWGRDAVITTCLLLSVATAVGLGLWAWLHRASFDWHVTARVRGWWRWQTIYKRRWREAMAAVGLTRVWDGVEHTPQVGDVRSLPDRDVLVVQLLAGQTPTMFAGLGEALAHVYRAFRVDVVSWRRGEVRITFLRHDPLDRPIGVTDPVFAHAVREAHALSSHPEGVAHLLDAVPVGVSESGHVATLRVRGGHVLVAGTTGSGKSGLLWAALWSLAPAIRWGLVEVFALDPKRMELARLAEDPGDGRGPLGVVVKDCDAMAAFLDGQVRDLDARCADLEGTSRKHTPTRTSPHRVIVIDELASITALAERKDRERIEAAIGQLESKGRAAGFTVIVTTVEPTKEVVRWRALHSVRVGFRLEEQSHSDMTLGDGARTLGAVCDEINPDTPGVAYLKVDGVKEPVRFRTAEITDDDLTTLIHGPVHAADGQDAEVLDGSSVTPTWGTPGGSRDSSRPGRRLLGDNPA